MITIGTPLSPNATKVMLLGSGELGREVVIALQRLGAETIAVDRYDNAPAQQLAHHARTISMTDPDQLRALIEAQRPDIVMPEIEAIATPMLEQLEAQGLVRVIPTARAARARRRRCRQVRCRARGQRWRRSDTRVRRGSARGSWRPRRSRHRLRCARHRVARS